MKDGYSYLTMIQGPRAGTSFLLDATETNRIGRGTDCDIILVDPLCSRVHAMLRREADGWWIQDADSRNGTFLNGQIIEHARLIEGSTFRVGSTEFTFHWSDDPPTMQGGIDEGNVEEIVQESSFDPAETSPGGIPAGQTWAPSVELMLLYQLSLKLLATPDPDDVVIAALEMLRERTQAAVIGFLWVNDDGQLTPKVVIPSEAKGRVPLSQSLTDIVCRKSRAVWVANQSRHSSPPKYTDAICVPLIHQRSTLGAIHLYRQRDHFAQTDFDLAISLAGLLVIALVRARQQASLQAEHRRLVASSGSGDELIGESRVIQELRGTVSRAARATGSALILGESGSGKELVARALHRESLRHDRPLLSVNCAAIPPDLIESHLFGHVKGAFTNADQDHPGWFQQANSGTLFLDEIGELPLPAQAKLLRILEGHSFQPLGGTKEVTSDVRIIAATNRDLRHLVNAKKFREDLFYRLSVFEIVIPPLRKREGDIRLLLDHFLHRFRQHHGRPSLEFSPAARQRLLGYHWPGNVRQLRNLVDSAVVLAQGEMIELADLGLQESPPDQVDSLRIDKWEQKLIRDALQRTEWRVPDAAQLLGIGRATLYRKLEEYKISKE